MNLVKSIRAHPSRMGTPPINNISSFPSLSPSMMSSFNAYEVLGVEISCSVEDLKSAYKKQLLLHHPDKKTTAIDSRDDNNDMFLKVQKAWKLVGSVDEREKYDRTLNVGQSHSNADCVGVDEFVVSDDGQILKKPCRCGDYYEITREDLLAGYNTVQCNSCSLYITLAESGAS